MTELDLAAAVASHEEDRRRLRRGLLPGPQNAADVEDAIQEGFLRQHVNKLDGEPAEKRRAFLFRVAKNWLIDLRRGEARKRRKQPALEHELTASSIVHPFDTHERELQHQRYMDALPKARETLDPLERQCWELRVEGLKLREIAEQTGLTTSVAAHTLARAKKKLKRYLDEHA